MRIRESYPNSFKTFVILQVSNLLLWILADLAIKESVVKVCRLHGIEPACQKKSSLVSNSNLIIIKYHIIHRIQKL